MVSLNVMNNNKPVLIYHLDDAFVGCTGLDDGTIDAFITDPPYFLDGLGNSWSDDAVNRRTTQRGVVSSLRAGMKFDRKQGVEFQQYMNRMAGIAMDKLKPGGWLVAFSSPRLYHRLGVGVEDAGFEIRDMWEWLYTQNQMKAMGLTRQLDRDDELTGHDRDIMTDELTQWKTPQVKSCFEPIVIAQKPREGTFYNNWKKYHIGLIDVKSGVGEQGDMDTSNVMTDDLISAPIDRAFLVSKPSRKQKNGTTHVSVKPLELMEHIITCLVPPDGVVVDPFNGSGSTGIAAWRSGRRFIGFENNDDYFSQSCQRLAANDAHPITDDDNGVIMIQDF